MSATLVILQIQLEVSDVTLVTLHPYHMALTGALSRQGITQIRVAGCACGVAYALLTAIDVTAGQVKETCATHVTTTPGCVGFALTLSPVL